MALDGRKTYKHGLYTVMYRVERFATVDPLVRQDCIMLDGDCCCFEICDCKYLDLVEKIDAKRTEDVQHPVPKHRDKDVKE